MSLFTPSRIPRAALPLALALALSLPVSAQQTVALAASRPDLPAMARAVPMGGLLRLEGLALDGASEPARVDLERFRVFSPEARVVLDDSSVAAAPTTAYFRGFVDGDPHSSVVLSVPGTGPVHGLVVRDGLLWWLQMDAGRSLNSRRIDPEADLAPAASDFECATDTLEPTELARTATATAPGLDEPAPSSAPASYTARLAVETDYEFYALFGDVQGALSYLGDLFAFASTIYQNEVATDLLVDYVSLWTAGADADPWQVTSGTSAALVEYRDYWRSQRTDVPRSLSHMLSGKRLGGGVAYLGTLCDTSYGYGLSASLNADFDIAHPASLWDIYVVSHEIGHSFDSPHTHDYCNIGGNRKPVDACVFGVSGPACNGKSGQLPAGCPDYGQGCGTLMSYCHQLSGTYGNIALTFGLGHPYGVEPDRVPARMYEHVLANASCLAPPAGGVTLTIDVQGTGAGSVTSDPPAIDCSDHCEQDFPAGTNVTLSATPQNGSVFTSWSGDADCADGQVLLSSSASCVASFESTCGNGVLDPNEECDGADLGGAVCSGDCAGAPTCTAACTLDYSTCTDGYCDTAAGESCSGCAADCVTPSAAVCGNGVCEIADGEDCVTCPTDCDGVQSGGPKTRFCCGYGGTNPVACGDNRCSDQPGESCITGSATACCGNGVCEGGEPNAGACDVDDCSGSPSVCGDGVCAPDESSASCPADCGPPPSVCGDGVCAADEDEIGCPEDCAPAACINPGGLDVGQSCRSDSECCSDTCRGKKGSRTCR